MNVSRGREFLEARNRPPNPPPPPPLSSTTISRPQMTRHYPFLSLEHAQGSGWDGTFSRFREGQGPQSLPVSQPRHHAQGRRDGGEERQPQEAKPPPNSTTEQATHPKFPIRWQTGLSPPRYRPKLLEEGQRFVKTAAGVEETPEREWKARQSHGLGIRVHARYHSSPAHRCMAGACTNRH